MNDDALRDLSHETNAKPLSLGVRFGWPLYLFGFAFLLTSFPIRNPDIWEHLAAGRSILTSASVLVSTTPVFDLLVYTGDRLGGGFLLAFLKAVAVGFLAMILYRTARPGIGGSLPAPIVGLVVLSLSLRANLQPQTATYCLLGLLMYGLDRIHWGTARRTDWLGIGLLFLVWANLDPGVCYGWLAVVMVGIGQHLDTKSASRLPLSRSLTVFAILTLACLANPGLVSRIASAPDTWSRVFPLELRGLIVRDGGGVQTSPVTFAYLTVIQDSPAALAYYPLLFLCVFGMLANYRGFRWERFLPALVFVGLSLLTDRAVPIFAIVCGAATSRNLAEALNRNRPAVNRTRSRGTAFLTTALCIVFLLAAWPGWLQRPPYEPRRWNYDLPTSPERAAVFLRTPFANQGSTLYLSAESQARFLWFCPENVGRYDRDLADNLLAGNDVELAMRTRGFARVVVDDPSLDKKRSALNVLLRDRHRWPLLHVDGGIAIFGWRDPLLADDPFSNRAIDLMQSIESRMSSLHDPIPDRPRFDVPPTRWEGIRLTFTTPARAYSRFRDESDLLFLMADVSRLWIPQTNGESWIYEQLAGLVCGVSAVDSFVGAATAARARGLYIVPPIDDPAAEPITRRIESQFEQARAAKDDFLTGALTGAIRAGRRAVAENPQDVRAHVILGEAYLLVLFESHERVWIQGFKQLRELRQAQAVTALTHAIRISRRPPIEAHLALARLYLRIGYLDLSLQQFQAARSIRTAATAGQSDRELDPLIERLAARVERGRDRFKKESKGLRVVDQARLADEVNLPGLALELLLDSDVAVFGNEGMLHQLELMVRTGRAREVVEWTSPEQMDILGRRNYHWWRAQAFAGLGDYDLADQELVEIGGGPADVIPDRRLLVASVATAVANDVLGESPSTGGFGDWFGRVLARSDAINEIQKIDQRIKNLAEIAALRAVLALERGDPIAAQSQAEAVLAFTPLRSGGLALPLRRFGEALLNRLPTAPRDIKR